MSSTDPQVPAPGPGDPWRKPETSGAPGARPDPAHGGYGEAVDPTPGYPTPPTSGYPTSTPGSVTPYAPGPVYPSGPQYPAPGGYAPTYGYGYGAYGYPKNSYAVWALVLGILSLVSCGFLTGIPAIIVGNNAKKAAAVGEANNPGMATAGVVTGWIGTALSAVGLVVYILWIVFAVAMVATTPST